MNINKLKEKLEGYEELKNKMFFGRESDNKYCIMQENGKQIVFYYERGERTAIKEFDDEEISLVQKKTYSEFMDNIKEIFNKTFNALKDYCSKNYNISLNETNFYKYIVPKQIYIKRESNGNNYCRLAILCNFKEDVENGLAVVCKNNEIIEVGMQDIIL